MGLEVEGLIRYSLKGGKRFCNLEKCENVEGPLVKATHVTRKGE